MNYKSIIILGYKRSGTSLLRVILNSHPDIAIGPEMKFMQSVTKSYPPTFKEFINVTVVEAADFEFSEQILSEIYNSSRSAAEIMQNWCNAYKNKTGKKIWGDKTPQNFKYLKMISENFPDSLFIHIVRHPYDVMRSSKKRNQFHGIHTIAGWLFSNINIKYVKNKNYMFMKYEDFVKDPGTYVSSILQKAGIINIDLLSIYQNLHHGKIADGDSWNKPVFKSREVQKEVLTLRDKFLIKTLCFLYFKKYGYS